MQHKKSLSKITKASTDHAELWCLLLHLWASSPQQRNLLPSTAALLSPSTASRRIHETLTHTVSPETTYTLAGPHLGYHKLIICMEESGRCQRRWRHSHGLRRALQQYHGPVQFLLLDGFSSIQSQHPSCVVLLQIRNKKVSEKFWMMTHEDNELKTEGTESSSELQNRDATDQTRACNTIEKWSLE